MCLEICYKAQKNGNIIILKLTLQPNDTICICFVTYMMKTPDRTNPINNRQPGEKMPIEKL